MTVLVFGFYFWQKPNLVFGTAYTLTQTDWSGGVSASTAAYPTNQTGWTYYSSASSSVNFSTVGQISLSSVSASTTQTTDTDFSAGTHSSTTISGTAAAAKLELASSTTYATSGVFTSGVIDLGQSVNFSNLNFNITLPASSSLVQTWGKNLYGQLGNGTTTDSNVPVDVSGIANVVSVAGGDQHSLALLSDGTIKSWGWNSSGQLGDGTTANKSTPVSVSGITNAVAVDADGYASMALLSDGTVKAWGYNGTGQLGNGTTTNSSTPVSVSGITNAVAIAAGYYHFLALLSDGTIKAWGSNGYGELGDGTTANKSTPVSVSGITNAVAVAGCGHHSMALLSDGTVKAWGANYSGQLGDNTTVDKSIPITVSNISNAVAIGCGDAHSLAVLSDGTVKSWGYNGFGQLGDETTITRWLPVTVSGVSNPKLIAAGGAHSLALLSNGTVMAWGKNDLGQLGDGTNINKPTPIVVPGVSNVVTLSAGNGGHSLVIRGGVEVQIATADSSNGPWNYSGTNGLATTTRTYFNSSGQFIPSDLDNKRYLKYKVYLKTNNTNYSPSLDDITVNYTYYPSSQSLISSAYNSANANNIFESVAWDEDVSLPSGAGVTVSLRTASSSTGLDSAAWSDFTNATTGCSKSGARVTCSSSAIPAGLKDGSNDQWFQYKTTLTSNGANTPTVSELIFSFGAPPSNPTIGTPTALSSSSIRWNFTDNADNETGFKIYTTTSNLVASSSSSNLTYIDETGLSENTQYARHVRAYNEFGDSANSSLSSYIYTLVDPPTNFTATTISSDSIALSVDSFPNSSAGSSGYYFSRAGANSGWIQNNSWTDTALSCGTSYDYSVKYRNGDGVDTSAVSLTVSTSDCQKNKSDIAINNNGNEKIKSSDKEAATKISINFSNNLLRGDTGMEIKRLQQFLNANGFKIADKGWGSPGKETEYFGPLTEKALIEFQKKHAEEIFKSDVGYKLGVLDFKTAEFINSLEKINFKAKQVIFVRDLEQGMQSEEVKELQKIMATMSEIYPEGLITGYFGPLTKKAIQRFQLKYGVVNSEFDIGFGRFGPKTRETLINVLNQ